MKLIIADNMGSYLETVSSVYAFQNFSPSSSLPPLFVTFPGIQV